jgi:indole-3-glycerol phosphate synthase
MSDILNKIIATKHQEVAAAKAAKQLEMVEAEALGQPAPRNPAKNRRWSAGGDC